MPDYIPNSDSDFNGFATNLVAVIQGDMADYGVSPPELVPLTAALIAWTAAFGAVGPAEGAFRAAVSSKVSAREVLAALIRALVKKIQGDKNVTNEAKLAAGITVADTTRTAAPIPTTTPVGRLEQVNRLEQIVHFTDSASPTSKGKPEGVKGCEVWIKIGPTPPTSVDELRFLATDTRSPYVSHFDPSDAGKTAYYWLRWVNNTGQPGPWGAMISATITG